jgi:nicotinamide phosphoribosyltransferase
VIAIDIAAAAIHVSRDVSKSPVTDPAKGSKAGRQSVVREGGRLVAQRLDPTAPGADLLTPVWRDGALLARHDFEAIRAR